MDVSFSFREREGGRGCEGVGWMAGWWRIGWTWTHLAVEKRTNGDESEKACACDAAQASSAAVVESFIVVMVM